MPQDKLIRDLRTSARWAARQDELILAALDAGHTPTAVAEAAGRSRQHIYNVLARRDHAAAPSPASTPSDASSASSSISQPNRPDGSAG